MTAHATHDGDVAMIAARTDRNSPNARRDAHLRPALAGSPLARAAPHAIATFPRHRRRRFVARRRGRRDGDDRLPPGPWIAAAGGGRPPLVAPDRPARSLAAADRHGGCRPGTARPGACRPRAHRPP